MYEKQTWHNGAEGGTPLSASRLNYIEDGIDQAHEIADNAIANTSALPFVVYYNSGWPARPTEASGHPVIWIGGAAPAQAPTANLNGDLWFPETAA